MVMGNMIPDNGRMVGVGNLRWQEGARMRRHIIGTLRHAFCSSIFAGILSIISRRLVMTTTMAKQLV